MLALWPYTFVGTLLGTERTRPDSTQIRMGVLWNPLAGGGVLRRLIFFASVMSVAANNALRSVWPSRVRLYILKRPSNLGSDISKT